MTDALELLKMDLHLSTTAVDPYLSSLLLSAGEFIETEGIRIDSGSPGDTMLLVQYAAFLYRSRAGTGGAAVPVQEMPRPLRWALNNRLMQQKGGGGNG